MIIQTYKGYNNLFKNFLFITCYGVITNNKIIKIKYMITIKTIRELETLQHEMKNENKIKYI